MLVEVNQGPILLLLRGRRRHATGHCDGFRVESVVVGRRIVQVRLEPANHDCNSVIEDVYKEDVKECAQAPSTVVSESWASRFARLAEECWRGSGDKYSK